MGLLWTVLMRREGAMRWVHLTVIILLAAATLLFVLQNRDVVTVLSGIQGPRASRNSDCSRLRHRSCNGRQLVCAIASILQRLATRSLALNLAAPSSRQHLAGCQVRESTSPQAEQTTASS
jgi:hypothetical protein